MKRPLLFLFFTALLMPLWGQNTVGLLSYDPMKTFDGYNLVFPHNQSDVYLFDNCGEIVHLWEDDDDFRPGNSVYLLENGDLIKCKRPSVVVNDPIWAGGGGATVDRWDWEGNLLWSMTINNDLERLHHDVAPMP
ncbi:MAG: hypothetical protein AAFU60_14620, partial [Bacteroidota bacterium]